MSTWHPSHSPAPNLSADAMDLKADLDDNTRLSKSDLNKVMLAQCREVLGRPPQPKPTRRIVCPACLIEIDIPDE
ncbi:MAG TPA: hypothetical protein VGF51_17330 [Acidimicrobiales bacterium]